MSLFKNVFLVFFSLVIFASNGVAVQEPSSDSLDQDFLLAVQDGDLMHVEFLLMSGADIDAVDELGRNALMLAADNYTDSRVEMLELLVAKGIDVNVEDADDRTALSYYHSDDDGPTIYSYERAVLLEAGAQWSDVDRRLVFGFGRGPKHAFVLDEFGGLDVVSLHSKMLPIIERSSELTTLMFNHNRTLPGMLPQEAFRERLEGIEIIPQEAFRERLEGIEIIPQEAFRERLEGIEIIPLEAFREIEGIIPYEAFRERLPN